MEKMEKKEIRRFVFARRKALTPEEITAKEQPDLSENHLPSGVSKNRLSLHLHGLQW